MATHDVTRLDTSAQCNFLDASIDVLELATRRGQVPDLRGLRAPQRRSSAPSSGGVPGTSRCSSHGRAPAAANDERPALRPEPERRDTGDPVSRSGSRAPRQGRASDTSTTTGSRVAAAIRSAPGHLIEIDQDLAPRPARAPDGGTRVRRRSTPWYGDAIPAAVRLGSTAPPPLRSDQPVGHDDDLPRDIGAEAQRLIVAGSFAAVRLTLIRTPRRSASVAWTGQRPLPEESAILGGRYQLSMGCDRFQVSSGLPSWTADVQQEDEVPARFSPLRLATRW
jgi:hypothetical protein